MDSSLQIDGIDVQIQGRGDETLLMIHGWPDTYRLWDKQVDAFQSRYRCVRFSLPGFETSHPRQCRDLKAILAFIDKVVEATAHGKPLTLMLHDWGCVFGYQYYLRHPDKVKGIIGVDIGDAGSREHRLSLTAKLAMLSYQLWLMAAWNLGGKLGDWMTRKVASILGAPAPADRIHAGMTYPYHWFWSSTFKRRPLGIKPLKIEVPFLYLYGDGKLAQFHSESWQRRMAAQPGNKVVALPTQHWVMVDQPDAFNQVVLEWLAEMGNPDQSLDKRAMKQSG